MKKTENRQTITISKLAFLDEMLDFPKLDYKRSDYDGEISYSLEIDQKFEELIKKLAAKALSEEELLEILGNSRREKYWKDSATITYSI
ncbi:MAG: hypothetical protein FMNOHCHN_03405 [Ignavibacteriaceae bacterium]|nr:hypothetical protein [Ignavibacteriaceae bacterium]